MRSILGDLFRPIGRWGLLALTVAVVGALLTASISAAALVLAHEALQASPELPDPGIDVAEIEDLTAASRQSASRASVLVDRHGDVFRP